MADIRNILIVDPDKELAASIAQILQAHGYVTTQAHDGQTAYEACSKALPDLILLEGLIPKMNGIDLAMKVRGLPSGANVAVLMTSAVYSGAKFRKQIEEAKIDDVLPKPFAAETLIAKIKLIEASRATIVPVVREAPKPFNSSGSLTETPFIQLVYHLHVRKETGTLRLEFGKTKKLITFEGGEPRFVVSNLEKECLGQLLVNRGRLTIEECQRSLDMMSQLKRRHGEILIQLGMLEPYELEEALKSQAREKLCEIFSWREGQYVFVSGRVFQKELTPVDLSLPQLCLRGVKEHYNLPSLQASLAPYFHSHPKVTEELFSIESFKLATWDTKIFRQVAQGKTLGQILSLQLARDLDVYHLVFTLFMLGVVRLVAQVSAATPQAQVEIPVVPAAEQTPFTILGVGEGASDAEIRKSFDARMNSLRGKPKDDPVVQEIKGAFETIGTLKSRRDYLMRIYEEQGKLTGSAREVFKPAELVAVGRKFLDKKDFVRAAKIFEDCLGLFPDDGSAYAFFGYTRIQAMRVSGAVDRAQFDKFKKIVIRGTQLSRSDTDVHYVMGRIFVLEQDYENAKLALQRALALNPENKLAQTEMRIIEKRGKKAVEHSFIRWKE